MMKLKEEERDREDKLGRKFPNYWKIWDWSERESMGQTGGRKERWEENRPEGDRKKTICVYRGMKRLLSITHAPRAEMVLRDVCICVCVCLCGCVGVCVFVGLCFCGFVYVFALKAQCH